MNPLKLTLIGVLWVTYGITLVRTMLKYHGTGKFQASIWFMYGLGCLAFTLTAQDTEEAVDTLWDGIPLSVYIKYFCLTHICYLYYFVTRTILSLTALQHRFLWSLYPISIVVTGATLVGLLATETYADPNVRYFVSAARDSVVAVYMGMAFIPVNRFMWRREGVATMRLKHTSTLLLGWNELRFQYP